MINNAFYGDLGERWYTATDDPVALLRAEAAHRNPWVLETIRKHASQTKRILDVGCGAGFLTNLLAESGFDVFGVDAAAGALEVAKRWDRTRKVQYQIADALRLPFEKDAFDVVCMMDFLEHVSPPAKFIDEAARVLRPGGLFFYHTFNRNPLAWLIAIKGVEWFVKNTPPNMHRIELFIRPNELKRAMAAAGLQRIEEWGSRPRIDRAFFQLLRTREVPSHFRFVRTQSRVMGYYGFARKEPL